MVLYYSFRQQQQLEALLQNQPCCLNWHRFLKRLFWSFLSEAREEVLRLVLVPHGFKESALVIPSPDNETDFMVGIKGKKVIPAQGGKIFLFTRRVIMGQSKIRTVGQETEKKRLSRARDQKH